jgi:hypothetical protein
MSEKPRQSPAIDGPHEDEIENRITEEKREIHIRQRFQKTQHRVFIEKIIKNTGGKKPRNEILQAMKDFTQTNP